MIGTTIEQSKHLLKLGLDPKTADMTYLLFADGKYSIKVEIGERPIGDSFLPAWSLVALLEVMPKELVNVGYNKKGEQVVSLAKLIIDTFIVDERSMWRIGYKGKRRYWVKCYSDNPIRAAWDMISFLIRQGYIKKGGER